ncbi:PREDICTED: glutathione synthetase, chloroplastic-like [Lupinus angustifolius]|uniref:glutathione synthetase, chloroplastic-like n=1 Tax=Lupinus angustifolius TaxID=3871 RepID=UPI00092F4FC6|nr:PREDICTED: glutathione synthetase, chloroplastic-like [Lupinus angustifolius]XP_019419965.1 PREDICTED: glutathione synthetase, chloroplastic-like [Lupinus angustifolius]
MGVGVWSWTRFLSRYNPSLSPSSSLSSSKSNLLFCSTNNLRFMSQQQQQQQHNLLTPIMCVNADDVDSSLVLDYHHIDQKLLQNIVYDSLVWSSLHGLVVADKSVQSSGSVPGVGLVHAPISLLPTPFPESHWRQASELAPIFNELVDRVSLDGKFLQESLSRAKKADKFTSRLLDIHSKMLEINKKEDIRLGLHRSDYMLDEQTKSLLQVELNTISSSFAGLGSLVSELHRSILSHYGKFIGLNSEKVPANSAASQFAEALAKAWTEFNLPGAVILFVVQAEERNMYDQHLLSVALRERHGITTIRKTLAEVDQEGELLPDGTLLVDGQRIAVIYFRAGYTPADYPSESEWRARLLMEQSSAVKCPSISYHLVGSKKIQQELTKPNVLERFLDNKDDIASLRKSFAGLWSLDDSDIVKKAIERPELFVMKPQREGGGNNIYGDAVRETLQNLQKAGSQEDAAYILMQKLFPKTSASILVRNGSLHKENVISELGVYGTYLRNKDRVILNNQSGYLMRTKVSSSDEGGVAAGFAVLDSVYLN